MKKVAILVADNLLAKPDEPLAGDPACDIEKREYREELDKLVSAFAQVGVLLEPVPWRQAASKAAEYEAMLPLLCWDYFQGNHAVFMEEMDKVSKVGNNCKLFNPVELLRWNGKKDYLEELERLGAPSIRTVSLPKVTEESVAKAMEELKADKVVIKPKVGGSSWRQVLYSKDEPFPSEDELPPEDALVQPFLPSVVVEGEYSFLYFGGEFSHGLVKRPKKGDYRVQGLFGGTEETYDPTDAELQDAQAVLDTLTIKPLYARVDLLRGTDGGLKLIELEMVEPYLYLPLAPGEGKDNRGAQLLAKSVCRLLQNNEHVSVQ
ncbi:expressed unknown protein [Seminavis robusta]|uniref:ATP-grasp domain-containing protein n=1 Tax=Seminavis robusta TaxID=568900 RepID=A0A9N8DI99_9STRA|nr:expressed unknown protein [Seminavis robusta]|eukprot:Sro167_g074400.1 n/a (320) ;mRNA; r:28031-28990